MYKQWTTTETKSLQTAIIMHRIRWHCEDHTPTVVFDQDKQHSITLKRIFRGWVDKIWQQWKEEWLQFKFLANTKKWDTAKQWTVYLINFFFKEGQTVWRSAATIYTKKLNEMKQNNHDYRSTASCQTYIQWKWVSYMDIDTKIYPKPLNKSSKNTSINWNDG